MGSKGTGSFSDYKGFRNDEGESTNQNGGSSGIDQCSMAFSTNLEEVSNCEYYKKSRVLPEEGTNVLVDFDKRLVIKNEEDIYIGYLPTKYNYLKACISDGFSYSGVIIKSSELPIPSITVDIAPNNE
jgi:hypothetical protein